jgi:hypothetical protein
MKIKISIALSMLLAAAAAHAQTLAGYESTVEGQSPSDYFTFDNSSLADTYSAAAFTNTSGATFASDYFGDANSGVTFAANTDNLGLPNNALLSGSGTATATGSFSFLFKTPSTLPTGTSYILSDGESTGSPASGSGETGSDNALALGYSGGAFDLKVGNKTLTVGQSLINGSLSGSAITLNPSTWYYFAMAYDLNTIASDSQDVSYYLGQAGQSSFLVSGIVEKGGSGNISSTADLGDGQAFALGDKQSSILGNGASSQYAAWTGGEVDELATWNSDLTSSQVLAQLNALVVPEPSTGIFLSAGMLLLACSRRAFRNRS